MNQVLHWITVANALSSTGCTHFLQRFVLEGEESSESWPCHNLFHGVTKTEGRDNVELVLGERSWKATPSCLIEITIWFELSIKMPRILVCHTL